MSRYLKIYVFQLLVVRLDEKIVEKVTWLPKIYFINV